MRKIPVRPVSVSPNARGSVLVKAAPYPLGCLISYAKVHDGGRLNEAFEFGRITPLVADTFLQAVEPDERPAVYMLSNYVWNHEANLRVAARIKERQPNALLVLGGPQIPRQRLPLHAFMVSSPAVDVVCRGEGEATFADLLVKLAETDPDRPFDVGALSEVAGITYRSGAAILDNPDRPRIDDLEQLPSPYLTGEFDHWIGTSTYMSLETNRGCPYGCTFCDWGAATQSKIKKFPMDKALSEIEYAGRHQIHYVYICDANFGVFPRDEEIADRFVQVREQYGYPKSLTYNNTKVARPQLKEIIRKFHRADLAVFGSISMQTTNTEVLRNIKRSNIKNEEYESLVQFYSAEGIDVLSELMLGLPGQTLQTLKGDLQFMFDRKVCVRIFETLVMPNAPMNDPDYKREFGLEVSPEGFVLSSNSFTQKEYRAMIELSIVYKLMANPGLGLLRYLLYFMQLDHKVDALDFILRWLHVAKTEPETYPQSHQMWSLLAHRPPAGDGKDGLLIYWSGPEARRMLAGFWAFLQEAVAIYRSLGVERRGTDLNAILRTQFALSAGRRDLPGNAIELPHDVPAYFAQLKGVANIRDLPKGFQPLARWPKGSLQITAAPSPRLHFDDYDSPRSRFELSSNVCV
jgi:radical SAM superfamily enzyme YgiQ (UPF0313 family)